MRAVASGSSAYCELPTAYFVLDMVRRQRVQMFTRVGCPPSMIVAWRTFALNVRDVLVALRSQLPDAWWRILRPITVPFPQT